MLHLQANTKEYDNYKKAYDTGALFEIEGFTLISKKAHRSLDREGWEAVHQIETSKEVISLSQVDIRLDVRENILKELENIRGQLQLFTSDDKTPIMIELLSKEYVTASKYLRMIEGHYMARDGHANYLPF